MWRHLVIALLCAAVGFGFNSNSPGGGGAVAGGNCTGGQFMSGITSAGVPVCSTPSGGAPFPPGNVPQITGFSALNSGEAETVVGDFTFARSGANQYTATVTQINHITPGGICSAGTFASTISSSGVPTCTAPPAPAAGSITDTMLTNAYSGVGACTAGSFVSTLNRNAAPTCTTPPTQFTAGGDLSGTATSQTVIGIRSTSVPALASGYLHYTGAAFVWDTPATGSFAPTTNPAGGQNNYAPIASPNFTGTVSVGGVALGSLYAPLSNPAGGQNNYAPLAAPTFTGTTTIANLTATGTVTLPAGSITDAMHASAYSGVGPCTAGTFVSTLNRNAAPTCTTPVGLFTAGGDLSGTATSQTVIGIRSTSVPTLASGYLHYTGSAFAWDTPATGSFAPLTNPAGGQNNYAPINAPTFTATTTAANLSVTGTSTFTGGSTFSSNATFNQGATVNVALNIPAASQITGPDGGSWTSTGITTNKLTLPAGGSLVFPDGATYTAVGLNSNAAIGIGRAVETGYLLSATANISGSAAIHLDNPNAGANAQTDVHLTTGTGGSIFPTDLLAFGPGYTGNVSFPASSAALMTSEPNGLQIGTFTTPNTIKINIASANIATFNTTGLSLASGLTYQVAGAQIKTTNLADRASGTWSPQLQFGGATTGIAYQSGWPYGSYWRIGSLVSVSWGIWLASKGTATGAATMCGLPYHVQNDGHNYGFYLLNNFGSLTGLGAPWVPGIYYGGNGQQCVGFGAINYNAAGNLSGLNDTHFNGVDNIQGSFEYTTNDP